MKRVAKIASQLKLTLQGWEDGFYGGRPTPYNTNSYPGGKPDLVTNVWMNRWEWGRAHRGYQMANAGYKVNTTIFTTHSILTM